MDQRNYHQHTLVHLYSTLFPLTCDPEWYKEDHI
jgi:hypothetical protein